MNVNYKGSLAERFMKFRSSLSTEENVSSNLFNAISIYVPKSLAENNLATGSYTPSTVTATNFALVVVTVDNYTTVLKDGSPLLSQWLPVFNDGANNAVTLYVVVFDDTDFAPTVTAGAITWQPLTTAFNSLFFISFFKTMFSEHYNGKVVTSDPVAETDYDDSNYFDMALALSYQCEKDSVLSFCLAEYQLEVFADGESDTNVCKVMSYTDAEEKEHCTTLTGSTKEDRADYAWGYTELIGANHSSIIVHNGNYLLPVILGKWFDAPNDSGEYVGNKMARVRLTSNKVQPTGLPSKLNSAVKDNLGSYIYDKLDAKNVGYFISIAESSNDNAMLISDFSISKYPIVAYNLAKCIDYNASQDLATYASQVLSSTKPILANEATYEYIQKLLLRNIQSFTSTGRITNIEMHFPPYAEAKVGNTFKGVATWSALYMGDFEGVDISGSVTF